MNTAAALAALRKRESELTAALIDLQGRLHEIRNAIAAVERTAMLSVERATGAKPQTGRPRRPVAVIGLPGHKDWPQTDPDPEDAA